MDINSIDNIPMLLDVRTHSHLLLDISLFYADKTKNRTVRIYSGIKYRIVYTYNHDLVRIVGKVINVSKIFRDNTYPDGTHRSADYVITIDASSEYGARVVKIFSSQIRAIREYTANIDDDTAIADATTVSATTVSTYINNAIIDNANIDSDGSIINGDITGGELPSTATSTDGLTTGQNTDGTDIIITNGTTYGGTISSGTLVKGSIPNFVITTNTDGTTTVSSDSATITKNSDGTYKIEGKINNVFIQDCSIVNGVSKDGEISVVVRENTIVLGGTITSESTTNLMKTTGGVTTITKDSEGNLVYTTTGGITTGGTVTGGVSITTCNGRTTYITGDCTTTGGTSSHTTIVGGKVVGGVRKVKQTVNGVDYISTLPVGVDNLADAGIPYVDPTQSIQIVENVIINSTVYGGSGTSTINTGGLTVGGTITFTKPFEVDETYAESILHNPVTKLNMKDTTDRTSRDTICDSGDSISDPRTRKYSGLQVGVGDITGVISNFHGDIETCDNTESF